MTLRYSERAHYCKNPVAKKLFLLMDTKQTNLALSADVTSCETLLKIANDIGPEICVLKTHVDILKDFSLDFISELTQLSKTHQFLIFEDRKFADIGNTVKHQYEGGLYHIADWADIVNAHSLPGPGIIQGLAEVGLKKERALLLLAEMSSSGHLMTSEYAKQTIAMAEKFPEFVIGFISQHKWHDAPQWIDMTPGVQFAQSGDSLGQQYVTPEQAIKTNGTDIIIVGRGILQSPDPLQAAREYRAAGWKAYQDLLVFS